MAASLSRAWRRAISIALAVGLLGWSCPLAWSASRGSTVVIDAGHGGFDRGGIPGQNVSKKAMALDVAQRLGNKLRRAGYRVVMTRDSDVFVPLGTRTSIANRYGDGIFVCIHFNSATRS